jgi:dTDP-4-dehydrorhamnose reductase
MRVFISGSEGYIGSALVHVIKRSGALFKEGRAPDLLCFDKVNGIAEDILEEDAIEFVKDWKPDAVVNLAGLSGQEKSNADKELAYRTNAEAPVRLREELLYDALFIQASTCSIYDRRWSDSLYARSKQRAEKDLLLLGGQNLILPRFGTVFGYNPVQMRWDLPMHRMFLDAVEKGVISIPPQEMWRPWTPLPYLADVITRWLGSASYGARFSNEYPMPIVSANAPLSVVAQGVKDMVPGTVIHMTENPDRRDYSAPQILGPLWPQAIEQTRAALSQILIAAYETVLPS